MTLLDIIEGRLGRKELGYIETYKRNPQHKEITVRRRLYDIEVIRKLYYVQKRPITKLKLFVALDITDYSLANLNSLCDYMSLELKLENTISIRYLSVIKQILKWRLTEQDANDVTYQHIRNAMTNIEGRIKSCFKFVKRPINATIITALKSHELLKLFTMKLDPKINFMTGERYKRDEWNALYCSLNILRFNNATGLRKSDLAVLKVGDLLYDSQERGFQLTIVQEKTHNRQVILIPNSMDLHIKDWLDTMREGERLGYYRLQDLPLFQADKYTSHNYKKYRKAIMDYVCDDEDVVNSKVYGYDVAMIKVSRGEYFSNLHKLRASFAQNLLANGANFQQASDALGHTGTNTIRHYAKGTTMVANARSNRDIVDNTLRGAMIGDQIIHNAARQTIMSAGISSNDAKLALGTGFIDNPIVLLENNVLGIKTIGQKEPIDEQETLVVKRVNREIRTPEQKKLERENERKRIKAQRLKDKEVGKRIAEREKQQQKLADKYNNVPTVASDRVETLRQKIAKQNAQLAQIVNIDVL